MAALLVATTAGAGLLLMRAAPMASLVVAVSPNVNGTVLIDGKPSGLAGHVVQVPTGRHSIGFEAEGWLTAPREAVLQADQHSTLTLALTPRPAVLAISRDPPDTALRLDERVINAGQGEVTVPAGRHSLTATHRGYSPLTLDLTLERGEHRMVKVALVPIVTQVVNLQAAPGQWSEPFALPPRTGFTLVLGSRIRLRIGQEVYLVGAGAPLNLGDVRAQSLQVKAVDKPVDVRVLLKPEG